MDPSQAAQHQQWMMSAGPQTHQTSAATTWSAPSYHQPTTLEEIRTLWIGDLQYWVDENYLHTCFAQTGEILLIVGFCVLDALVTELYFVVSAAVYPASAYTTPAVQPYPAVDNDPTNTTIFVGNLDPNITEEELRQLFAQFGELVYVKIPPGKGCGFVQFGTRAPADEAMQRLNGTVIGQQTIRLSWGKSMTTKQDQAGAWAQPTDPNQWSAAYYGYGQGYDAYAYGASQDPSLYAYGAYAGYAQYPQQAEGMQEMVATVAPVVEQREEAYDPLYTPDVDKLNAAYLAVHGSAMVGRPLWLKTSSLAQQA